MTVQLGLDTPASSRNPQPTDGRSWARFYRGLLAACADASQEPATRLRLARAFIDRNYDQPLDLGRIARQAQFSPYHFLRLSGRPTGTRRTATCSSNAFPPPDAFWKRRICR